MPEQALKEFLHVQLAAEFGIRRLVCGYSGGLDSTVLLHGLVREAAAFGLPVLAVHVHHGLSPNADAWAEHAAEVCKKLGIALQVQRVVVSQEGSLEAAARDARRQAFAAVLQAGDALLLAQHQDDQAETLLFRLLRGSGVTGLGAMQAVSRFPLAQASVPLWRPLLGVSRQQLESAARAAGLSWVEDESNQDEKLARNFLRHRILPLLLARWPAVAATFAATAQRMQEADALLNELAEELAQEAIDARQRLGISVMQSLSAPKQRLLLRYWLRQQGFLLPDEALLQAIIDEILPASEDATPMLALRGVQIRRYREHLYAMTPLSSLSPGWEQCWDGLQPLPLPDGRVLRMESAPELLRVSYRRGGERLRPAGQLQSRELKTLFQENAVPPWERERLPLLWRGDELVAVAGTQWGRADQAPLTCILTVNG